MRRLTFLKIFLFFSSLSFSQSKVDQFCFFSIFFQDSIAFSCDEHIEFKRIHQSDYSINISNSTEYHTNYTKPPRLNTGKIQDFITIPDSLEEPILKLRKSYKYLLLVNKSGDLDYVFIFGNEGTASEIKLRKHIYNQIISNARRWIPAKKRFKNINSIYLLTIYPNDF